MLVTDIQNPIFSAPCPVHVRVDAGRGTTYANVTLVQPEAQDNSGNVNVSRLVLSGANERVTIWEDDYGVPL